MNQVKLLYAVKLPYTVVFAIYSKAAVYGGETVNTEFIASPSQAEGLALKSKSS